MTSGNDLQVRAVSVLESERIRAKRLIEEAHTEIRVTRQTLNELTAYSAQILGNRSRDYRNCDSETRHYHRDRYEMAQVVHGNVKRMAAELGHRLQSGARVIANHGSGLDSWLARLVDSIQSIGGPGTSTVAEMGGVDGHQESSLGSASDSLSGEQSMVIPGLDLGSDVERVRLDQVQVPPDLFETEPAKGGASKDDMIWAARTFRDVVVGHAARGGTRQELVELDEAEGRTMGFRRRAGSWDVYLGSDIPRVDLSTDGRVVDVTGGRHRILAAQMAGLQWIPMKVHRLSGT